MIVRDDLPPTPDWDGLRDAIARLERGEGLAMPLLWPGDQA